MTFSSDTVSDLIGLGILVIVVAVGMFFLWRYEERRR